MSNKLALIVLVVALTTTAAFPLNQDQSKAPAVVQFMNLNPVDGQYAFGYHAADASREERRHADGTIDGKYSYRNPDGKLINVSYGADANGFQAFGDNIPPVDTPEVQEAKERFMTRYAKEVARNKGSLNPSQVKGQGYDHLVGVDSVVVIPTVDDEGDSKSAQVLPSYGTNLLNDGFSKKPTGSGDTSWFYGMDMRPVFTHSYPSVPAFLIPIPVSALRTVSAIYDSQVPSPGHRLPPDNSHSIDARQSG